MLVDVIEARLRVVGHDEDRGRTPLGQPAQVVDDQTQRPVAVGHFFGQRRNERAVAAVVRGQEDRRVGRHRAGLFERVEILDELFGPAHVANAQIPGGIVRIDASGQCRRRGHVDAVASAQAAERSVLVVDARKIRIVEPRVGAVALVEASQSQEIAVIAVAQARALERVEDVARARIVFGVLVFVDHRLALLLHRQGALAIEARDAGAGELVARVGLLRIGIEVPGQTEGRRQRVQIRRHRAVE